MGEPLYSVKAHKTIVNNIDGCGGLRIGGCLRLLPPPPPLQRARATDPGQLLLLMRVCGTFVCVWGGGGVGGGAAVLRRAHAQAAVRPSL
jgi:hypothetical protein